MLIAAVSNVSLLTHNGSDIYSTVRYHHHHQHHQQQHHLHRHSTLVSSSASGTLNGVARPTDLCLGRTRENSLVFVETIPGELRCVAIGGYPPPEVQLYVGRRDVTADFGLTHVARLVGTRGQRVMHHVTERWSNRFTVGAIDDGNRITCIVSVSGLATTICSARLNVYRK